MRSIPGPTQEDVKVVPTHTHTRCVQQEDEQEEEGSTTGTAAAAAGLEAIVEIGQNPEGKKHSYGGRLS